MQDAAGNDLIECLKNIPENNGIRCEVGQAKLTPAFNLEQNGIKYIIHTVGPNLAIDEEKNNKEKLIADAYRNSLQLAAENNITSIAFPAISAAIFGYDIKISAPIVIDTVIGFLEENPGKFKEIYFVFYNNDDAIKLYSDLFQYFIKSIKQ
ncbi:macro domain-containing protein [Candidatus Dependentiae bacterium]|nr:macro domain-containing protein [Candidatus Dependentiae bacterium]